MIECRRQLCCRSRSVSLQKGVHDVPARLGVPRSLLGEPIGDLAGELVCGWRGNVHICRIGMILILVNGDTDRSGEASPS